MNRYFVFVALMVTSLLAVPLSAEDTDESEVASQAAVAYVEAFMDGRISEAYLMLAAEERDGVSQSQYESYVQATFPTADRVAPVRETYPALYDFVIDNLYRISTIYSERVDTSVVVNIELSTIDLLSVAFEIAGEYPDVNSGEKKDSEINDIYKQAIAELYRETEPPRTAIRIRIGVTSEEDRLAVLPGIRESFDRMRAGELSGQAWEAKFDGRTEYAATLYAEASELDPDNSTYTRELTALNARLDDMQTLLDRETAEYAAESLSIETSKAELTGFPAIVCSIQNGGDKSVDRFEFRIAYLDDMNLLMAVEIGIHDFWGDSIGANELKRDVRIDTYEAPFSWPGNRYDIEIIRENP